MLLAGLAFDNADHGLATEERVWAGQVVASLIQSEGGHGAFYNNGDEYAYPMSMPGKELFYVLAAASDDTMAKSYANYVIQNYPDPQRADYLDMLFRDPAASASTWTSVMPPHLFLPGTGLLVGRADWSYGSTWLSFQLGNMLWADHQGSNPGHMQIQRGKDDLLVNANAVGEQQDPHAKSSFSNLIAIDDNGEGAQNYRWNMGFWYGTPGVFITSHEETAPYVYIAGDYHNAYSRSSNPDGGGSCSELTRDILYVRPNSIFVYDRATTIKSTYPKQLQWHVLACARCRGQHVGRYLGREQAFRGYLFAIHNLDLLAGRST